MAGGALVVSTDHVSTALEGVAGAAGVAAGGPGGVVYGDGRYHLYDRLGVAGRGRSGGNRGGSGDGLGVNGSDELLCHLGADGCVLATLDCSGRGGFADAERAGGCRYRAGGDGGRGGARNGYVRVGGVDAGNRSGGGGLQRGGKGSGRSHRSRGDGGLGEFHGDCLDGLCLDGCQLVGGDGSAPRLGYDSVGHALHHGLDRLGHQQHCRARRHGDVGVKGGSGRHERLQLRLDRAGGVERHQGGQGGDVCGTGRCEHLDGRLPGQFVGTTLGNQDVVVAGGRGEYEVAGNGVRDRENLIGILRETDPACHVVGKDGCVQYRSLNQAPGRAGTISSATGKRTNQSERAQGANQFRPNNHVILHSVFNTTIRK